MGCGYGFGGNCCWWIIILILLFVCCGNGCGGNCGCDNGCGCNNGCGGRGSHSSSQTKTVRRAFCGQFFL